MNGRVNLAPIDGEGGDIAVSPPDSPSERQAESVSKHVSAGRTAPPISPMREVNTGLLRRREGGQTTANPTALSLQAGRVGEAPDVAADPVARAINGRGAGHSVNPTMRPGMERKMGANLAGARIHRDSTANEAADALKARAFTHGRDVYMGRGESERDVGLMSHELTHVVQNAGDSTTHRWPIVNRAPAAAAGSAPKPGGDARSPAAEKPKPPDSAVAPGVVELMGKPGFEATQEMIDFIEDGKKGVLNAQFGSLARGPLEVSRKGNALTFRHQPLPLQGHPLFAGLQQHAPDLAPALIVSGNLSSVTGYVAPAAGARVGQATELLEKVARAPEVLGLTGFTLPQLKPASLVDTLESGSLKLGLEGATVNLGGAFEGTITFLTTDGKVDKFEAKVSIQGDGLATTELELARTDVGAITGHVMVAVTYKQVSGSVDVTWDGHALTGTGKVGYQGEKFSGDVTVYLMEKAKAIELARQKQAPPEDAKQPAPAEKSPGGAIGRAKKEDCAVFGEGDLTFAFTDWLNGTAHVIIDHEGHLTIIGKITPQAEFTLFEQKHFDKELFKLEARAAYGMPVVGNIFIFGNVSLSAFADMGPGKLYKIEAQGTYSTDPTKAKDFSIQCSLNISAAAGLRLRGEAGAGLEILSHDIKAGAGINALAGIKGYAEATPVIGYREKAAAPGADLKGEFFIKGDLELAAQPFLGLGGDLFVEVDAPWWSPVPDKKWTWPLGQKEWPVGGSFGVVASVEHVIGSKQWPSVEFKPVEFSSDKFLSDLYSDKASPKGGDKGDQPGTWSEKNSPDAKPPDKSAVKGVPPGKAAAPPETKSTTAATKGGKQAGKSADLNARTADGKTVKQLQDEATKKGKKPTGPETAKGAGKDEKAKKPGGQEEHANRLAEGLSALDEITARYAKDGATKDEVVTSVKSVRRKFSTVFKSLEVIEGSETWDYSYEASPKITKSGAIRSKAGRDLKTAQKEFKKSLFTRDALQKLLSVSRTTALDRITQWKQDGVLFEKLSQKHDKETKYSFEQKQGGKRETAEGNRARYGYQNPKSTDPIALEILSKGIIGDPTPAQRKSLQYHQTEARYENKNPKFHHKEPFGWDDAYLGHKIGASEHWNTVGHKQTKKENQAWNRNPENYWGPEYGPESTASGGKAEKYRLPDKESHPSWLEDLEDED